VVDIVECEGRWRIAGLLDDFLSPGEHRLGYPVVGGVDDTGRLVASMRLAGAIVAIGDNFQRAEVVGRMRAVMPALRFVSTVHPASTVARDVALGDGTVVMAGAVVNSGGSIGPHCVVNTAAVLDHDGVLGEYASLGPGAVAGGRVTIGPFTFVGAGVTIAHGQTVGEHTVIGAGAVVVAPLGSNVVAFGVPARPVRTRSANMMSSGSSGTR
jgi:sugar O-acyltransferase (sialic acid O-acetyltransferase NeuD family)